MLQVNDLVWSENGSKEVQKMREWLKENKVDELPRAALTTEELETVCFYFYFFAFFLNEFEGFKNNVNKHTKPNKQTKNLFIHTYLALC